MNKLTNQMKYYNNTIENNFDEHGQYKERICLDDMLVFKEYPYMSSPMYRNATTT